MREAAERNYFKPFGWILSVHFGAHGGCGHEHHAKEHCEDQRMIAHFNEHRDKINLINKEG